MSLIFTWVEKRLNSEFEKKTKVMINFFLQMTFRLFEMITTEFGFN